MHSLSSFVKKEEIRESDGEISHGCVQSCHNNSDVVLSSALVLVVGPKGQILKSLALNSKFLAMNTKSLVLALIPKSLALALALR